ncbi:MAG: PD-(D/E)XK nuclease family protein, partial [Pseudomonadota bacterium]
SDNLSNILCQKLVHFNHISSIEPTSNQTCFVNNIQYINADNLQNEANIIAIISKYYLSQNRKVNIITNNFKLIQYIEAALGKYDIIADNSLGKPISMTPIGTYMKLLLFLFTEKIDPLNFITLLKHPLTCCGMDNYQVTKIARNIEKNIFRKQYFYELTLHDLLNIVEDLAEKNNIDTTPIIDLINYLLQAKKDFLFQGSTEQDALSKYEPSKNSIKNPLLKFSDILNYHVKLAEKIAFPNQELWQNYESEQYYNILEQLQKSAKFIGKIRPSQYAKIFTIMMTDYTIRRQYNNSHITILTAKEARINQHDVNILADFNQNNWPINDNLGKWLSYDMQELFNIKKNTENIGVTTYLLMDLLQAKNVIISRSKNIDNAPTKEPIFLNYFKIIYGKYIDSNIINKSFEEIFPTIQNWQEFSQFTDHKYTQLPAEKPKINTEIQSRPTIFSATDLEYLISNPYHIYAKKILNLKKLNPINAEPDMSDFGNFVHYIFYQYNKYGYESYDDLVKLGYAYIKRNYANNLSIEKIWWPIFLKIARWFYQQDKLSRADKRIFVEIKGEYQISSVMIHAKADRMELSTLSNNPNTNSDGDGDGNNIADLHIIDYKTGTPPTKFDLLNGLKPQLLIETLIAQNGGFQEFSDIELKVKTLSFWQMKNGTDFKIINFDLEKNQAYLVKFSENLANILNYYQQKEAIYLYKPNPAINNQYDTDYELLARYKEWC